MLILAIIDSTPTPATLSLSEHFQKPIITYANHIMFFDYFLNYHSHENRLLIAELKQTNPEYFL